MLRYTSYPTTDKKVYTRQGSSLLFERGAVIVEIDDKDEDNKYKQVFVDTYGVTHDSTEKEWQELDMYQRYNFVGTVGDTVAPIQLGEAWNFLESEVDETLEEMETFFKIDKTKAEDVLCVELGKSFDDKLTFSFRSRWYGFPNIELSFNTLDNLLSGTNIDKDEEKNFKLKFIRSLVHYSNFLQKQINLRFYWNNDVLVYSKNGDFRGVELNKNNRWKDSKVFLDKYLQALQGYIHRLYVEDYNRERNLHEEILLSCKLEEENLDIVPSSNILQLNLNSYVNNTSLNSYYWF